jgi:release factor glutamine methyltransferase
MPSTWRVIDLIHWAESYLKEKKFDNPRAEIEWLLCALLDCNRLNVYLRFEEPLSQSQLTTLRSWVKRRLKNEPLQYITGSCDFYGRQFLINSQVLIPRPETERLIDIAIEKMKGIDSPTILDVGTGSGCIATTLGLEIPASKVLGLDVSLDAGISNPKVVAMHPEPVPTSSMVGESIPFIFSMAISISRSVSGRGISTCELMRNCLP